MEFFSFLICSLGDFFPIPFVSDCIVWFVCLFICGYVFSMIKDVG